MKTPENWLTLVDSSDGVFGFFAKSEIKKIQLDALNEAAILVRTNENYHETDHSNSNVLIDLIEKLGGTASIVR
jgi:hypothetical protein